MRFTVQSHENMLRLNLLPLLMVHVPAEKKKAYIGQKTDSVP